jgi:hypothetical protein
MAACTRDVCGRQLGKHVPAATDLNIRIAELCGPCRDVIRKREDSQFSSVRESVKRGLEPEAEE